MLRGVQSFRSTCRGAAKVSFRTQVRTKASRTAPAMGTMQEQTTTAAPMSMMDMQPTAAPKLEKQAFINASTSPIIDCAVLSAQVSECGDTVQVDFSDGSSYEFHGLWLRDACRDDTVVAARAGERYLDRIPWATRCSGKAKSAAVVDGNLQVIFESDHPQFHHRPLKFPSGFLRMYGSVAGRAVNNTKQDVQHHTSGAFKWLEAYSGFEGTLAPNLSMKKMFKNENVACSQGTQFQHRDYNSVKTSDAANLEMLQALMEHGVMILDNAPNAADSSIVRDFADNCLGGMQKDPARDEPNWVIKRKDGAVSVSYDQPTRLNNHTDQSVPAHGIPALLLTVHYVSGTGINTLVDAYAVAEALRTRDPAAFHVLSTYSNCQQRDFVASRVDSVQKGTQSMLVSTKKPIIQLDTHGNVIRVQFNEVFRTPSTVPFGEFQEWYRAYTVWSEMIHGPEFEVEVPLGAGQILVIDNWRVLHGRAAKTSSPERCIMGGTVVREAFHSRAVQLMGSEFPKTDYFKPSPAE